MSTAAARGTGSDARPSSLGGPRVLPLVFGCVVAGLAAGFALGSRTGVKDALDAARSIDAQTLAKALAFRPEAANGVDQRREIARLLDEVRATRALIESLRHDEEWLRVGTRLRALETARDAGAARLERLESRLGRLENARIDPTPTGSVPKKIGETR